MDKIINHLLQLQELALAYDEHRQVGDGAHLQRLTESIKTLTAKLPPDTRDIYQRLSKRDRVTMAPVHDGSCTMCGMKLPISQVQAVRRAGSIENCPSCARIMFDSNLPQWSGERTRRRGPPKTGIARFSSESLMAPDLKGGDMASCIREMAEIMRSGGFVEEVDKLIDAALEREAILSTALDNGIAFPHVRGVEGGGLAIALGVSRQGIVFDSGDTPKSHLIFFSVIPTAVSAFYLKLLSGITEALVKQENRDMLMSAESPDQLWKALTRVTRYTLR